MKEANRVNNNEKWIRDQMKTLRDGEIVFIWHDKSARIRDIDNELKLNGMQVDKCIGKHYVMFKQKEEIR